MKPRLWVMHSGQHEQAHDDFLRGYISLGWEKLGDLDLLRDDRKVFRRNFRQHYPEESSGAVDQKAGELYRFVHEMKPNDLVIYPSKKHGVVRVGRVNGPYQYKPGVNRNHPHVRRVEWLKKVRREPLSPNIKRAMSGRLSLYEPHKHARALRTILLARNAA